MIDEQQRQVRFAIILAVMLLAGTLFVYSWKSEQYAHPMPEKDCSQPYEYPMCRRAVQPAPQPEPTAQQERKGLIITGLLGIVLIALSHAASVTKQEHLNITGQRPVAPSKPAAEPQRAWAGGQTPASIPNNAIKPEEIKPVAPPKQQPAQGVDPKQLGGRNG